MSHLAMAGGPATVPQQFRQLPWPVVTASEEQALTRVLASGKFTSMSYKEQEVPALEHEWAAQVQTSYCAAVSSGTAALTLSLAAAGIGPGDEVLVPALSFIATATAPFQQMAIPVFVDIDPFTFNIDPEQLEQHITERTRAILPVHLHGLPADMDKILAIAHKFQLLVIEDAAQAHGATYKQKQVGSLGDIAAFSLNVSKNLPTCGEGGLITTDNEELYQNVLMLRQFGERIEEGKERSYISHQIGWNHKLNSLQAAFARSQLTHFPAYEAIRQQNVPRFLASLADLPAIICPYVASDRTHAWHILRLRLDPRRLDIDTVSPRSFRLAVQRALRAEGVAVTEYQKISLPAQPIFQEETHKGSIYPWELPGLPAYHYHKEDYPQTNTVLDDSFTIQRVHLHPHSATLLEYYTEAFHKVFSHLDTLVHLAHTLDEQAGTGILKQAR